MLNFYILFAQSAVKKGIFCAGIPKSTTIFSHGNQNDCFFNAAVREKNSMLCTRVVSIADSGLTRDLCYYNIAVQTRNISLCERVVNSAECRANIIKPQILERQNITLCNELAEDQQDRCYNESAAKTGDSTICEKIVSSVRKDGCYGFVAEKTHNVSLCDKMSRGRIDCYITIAEITKNSQLCGALSRKDLDTDKAFYSDDVLHDPREACLKASSR